ncbi:MAG: hypothetical protein UY13_C0002G0142 [Candidatus Pacebacteria bacterium GW2011_GWB1_47_8]|nr:MAG: hypothetical protein UX28_C0001G0291 [Candidatus Pacebacteria bacterium GW2011_GWA1_46_10]KKU84230.1 MAG: hypothetical protein UY13_C0002G0142 [Candidatus Pacebacteria bacterium GW2011_GWB1_47_8]HCR81450.1 hypothetical protein [Candidatus Paceibacterota bacterium]
MNANYNRDYLREHPRHVMADFERLEAELRSISAVTDDSEQINDAGVYGWRGNGEDDDNEE